MYVGVWLPVSVRAGPPVLYMKGSAHGGWMKADYPRLDAGFTHLKAICTSPEPGVYYLADETAVRVCSADDRVSVVAGERQAGWADGMGPEAQFRDMKAIVCDSKHKQLWLISNLRLRTVFIGSRMVSTIAGDGKISARDGVGTDCSLCDPRDLCFYKSSPSSAAAAAGGKKPESVLFISSSEAIRRFDLNERRMTTLQLKDAPTDFDPMAIACTSGGMLLVTCCETNVMFAVDPITGDVDRIGGDRLTARGKPVAVDGPALTHGRFADPVSITVNDSQQFVLVADGRNARVRSLNLPPHFFADLSK